MGIGDINTRRSQEWMARTGKTYQAPGHPDLPDLASDGPAFVVTGGDTTDRVATEVIEGMHDLYRVEGARMAAAHESRLIAGAQRKAFLLAHPPKPEDVTVLFWERPHPARPTMPVTTEGGGQ
jgi:hypothetical protein